MFSTKYTLTKLFWLSCSINIIVNITHIFKTKLWVGIDGLNGRLKKLSKFGRACLGTIYKTL